MELPGIGTIAGAVSARPIHCIVQRRILIIAFTDRVVELVYPCPTVPAASTSASCMRECLDLCPQVKQLQTAAKQLMASAYLGLEGDGSDGAFSNLKYEGWRETAPLPDDLDEQRLLQLCGNHQVHITEVLVEKLLGQDKQHVSKATSFIVLMRSGGFFLRCLTTLFPEISANLHMVTCLTLTPKP